VHGVLLVLRGRGVEVDHTPEIHRRKSVAGLTSGRGGAGDGFAPGGGSVWATDPLTYPDYIITRDFLRLVSGLPQTNYGAGAEGLARTRRSCSLPIRLGSPGRPVLIIALNSLSRARGSPPSYCWLVEWACREQGVGRGLPDSIPTPGVRGSSPQRATELARRAEPTSRAVSGSCHWWTGRSARSPLNARLTVSARYLFIAQCTFRTPRDLGFCRPERSMIRRADQGTALGVLARCACGATC